MLKGIAYYHKYQKKWGGIAEFVLSRSPQVTSLCVTKANTSLTLPGVQEALSAHRTLYNRAGNVCSLVILLNIFLQVVLGTMVISYLYRENSIK